MLHSFQSIDGFLFSVEKEIMDMLFDYGLLTKFDYNVKKIIVSIFVKRITDKMKEDNELLFYHNRNISDDHELFEHFDKVKLNDYINKICNKIKKSTNRLFFLNKKITLPEKSYVNDLDGSVIDQIFLLKESKAVDPKALKEFLNKHHLKDIFKDLSKKVC
jgi:hypothetical protein